MTVMQQRAADPIDAFTDLMDGFSEYIIRAGDQVQHGRQYRLNLLWIHALFALLMGPTFMALGRNGMTSAAWFYLRSVPGAPASIGAVLVVGGFILGTGCVLRNRVVECVGLVAVAAFYLTIAVGFGAANIHWYTSDTPIGPKPASYAPLLYLHLVVIMCLHLWTLIGVIRRGTVL